VILRDHATKAAQRLWSGVILLRGLSRLSIIGSDPGNGLSPTSLFHHHLDASSALNALKPWLVFPMPCQHATRRWWGRRQIARVVVTR
jgi:hypothetical protein